MRLAHAEALQIQRQRTLVENTHDHRLAVQRRHRRNADVNFAALEAQRDVAVLRNIALGDIHSRHDLDAADERRLQVLGRLRLRYQHSVDAILDAQLGLKRLDVHIAGSALNRLKKNEVDQVDEGRLLRHPVDIVGLNGVEVVLVVGGGGEASVGRERLGHACGGGAVAITHEFAKRGRLKADAANGARSHGADFIDGRGIERIQHCNEKLVSIEGNRYCTQSYRDLRREQFRCGRIRGRSLVKPVDPEQRASLAHARILRKRRRCRAWILHRRRDFGDGCGCVDAVDSNLHAGSCSLG